MKIAICDDEQLEVEVLNQLISEHEHATTVRKFTDLEQLKNRIISNERFDLVFMDINWKAQEFNGVEFADMINQFSPNTQIVFVSSLDQQHLQNIFLHKINLCGFLVKPVEKTYLYRLIDKAYQNLKNLEEEKLVVKQRGTIYAVPYSNIVYVESSAHQLLIHTRDEHIKIYRKIDELAEQLPDYFVQCHKSYLVNMNFIKRIENNDIYLYNEEKLSISKAKYVEMMNRFFEYTGAKDGEKTE